jgi:hypothetical protein
MGPGVASSSARRPVWFSAAQKLSTPRKGSVSETFCGRLSTLLWLIGNSADQHKLSIDGGGKDCNSQEEQSKNMEKQQG